MAKIAFMLPKLSMYGGVEQFSYRLAEIIAESHDIDFICSRIETPPPFGVTPIVVGRPFGFKGIKVFWYLLCAEYIRRKGNYDLVLSFGRTWNQDILRVGGGPQKVFWEISEKAWPQGFLRWSKRFRRYINPTNWLTGFIDVRQLRHSRRIVCVSDLVKQWILEKYPDVCVSDVIYNFPDIKRYTLITDEQRRLARATYNFNINQIVIGTATSNFALKGTRRLIQALAYLPNNYVLLIAGGRKATRYKKIVLNLGLQDRVIFIGRIKDPLPFYRALDIFALPTYYDACSNAVLEARACGLRVLSTIYNGSSVFLPKDWIISILDNPEYIAQKIIVILNDPEVGSFFLPQNVKAGFGPWIELIKEMLKEKQTGFQ